MNFGVMNFGVRLDLWVFAELSSGYHFEKLPVNICVYLSSSVVEMRFFRCAVVRRIEKVRA